MPDKCISDPERDCLGIDRAKEIASDVKALDRRLVDFQQAVATTNGHFGARIQKLEAHNDVQDEKLRNLREKLDEISNDVKSAQQEQKASIAELRQEQKAAMDELKRNSQEILDSMTFVRHKVDEVDRLRADVTAIQQKPAKTWEDIKSKALGWAVLLVLGILAVAMGLGRYL